MELRKKPIAPHFPSHIDNTLKIPIENATIGNLKTLINSIPSEHNNERLDICQDCEFSEEYDDYETFMYIEYYTPPDPDIVKQYNIDAAKYKQELEEYNSWYKEHKEEILAYKKAEKANKQKAKIQKQIAALQKKATEL